MRKLKTMDGNTAAAHVAYAFSEVAAIYPITAREASFRKEKYLNTTIYREPLLVCGKESDYGEKIKDNGRKYGCCSCCIRIL